VLAIFKNRDSDLFPPTFTDERIKALSVAIALRADMAGMPRSWSSVAIFEMTPPLWPFGSRLCNRATFDP
jgi:hypothetical protein